MDVNPLPLPKPPSSDLIVEGARQNNLKNISLRIPHNRVTAVTGLSGSGKSSLAFDTLFAEGQWRYVESLSTYARMFIDKVARPDVDRILNVRPAIAIEQKNQVRTARSTVGTTTEIADLLRLLFAKIGKPFCPDCHQEARSFQPDTVATDLLDRFPEARAMSEIAHGSLIAQAEAFQPRATSRLDYIDTARGAAALLIGAGAVVARPIAMHSRTVDFVDHYRGQGFDYDYVWEERWVRDEVGLLERPGDLLAEYPRAGAELRADLEREVALEMLRRRR